MSVFISEKLKTVCNEVVKTDWNCSTSLLAVATCNHARNGDASVIDVTTQSIIVSISRPSIPSQLAWHPSVNVLAVGWSSGCISILHVTTKKVIDAENISSSEITCMIWSSEGTILLTTDNAGFVYMWLQTISDDKQPSPYATINIGSKCMCAVLLNLCFYEQENRIICRSETGACVEFAEPVLQAITDTNRNFKYTSQTESATFLLGCTDGRVLRITGEINQHTVGSDSSFDRVTDVFTCEGSVLTMRYQIKSGNLAVLTDKGMLHYYKICKADGTLSREMTKVKLAVGSISNPSLVWVDGSVLAMATGEPFVRLWDVERADNYTLVPNIELNKAVKVTHIAYSSNHQTLAAGLSNGMVAFWKYAADWSTEEDLSKVLQSNPTWTGDHEEECTDDPDLARYYTFEMEYTQPTSASLADKGPEADWYPQPTTVLTSCAQEDIATGNVEVDTHIRLMVWNSAGDRMAIAVSALHPDDKSTFRHGLTPKCAMYILVRQSLCGTFGGEGCAIVQTGPRSLAMFASGSSCADPAKTTSACVSKGSEINPMATPQSDCSKTSLKTSSTVFSSGCLMKAGYPTNLLQDDSNSVPSVREHEAQVDDQIRALYCTREYISYWNGHRISTFTHSNDDCITHHASFPCEFRLVGLFDQSLFTVEQFKLHVRSLQGTVKQLVNFSEGEGSVLLTDRCANYMACFTDQGKVRVFDVDRREVKSVHTSKPIVEMVLPVVMTNSECTSMAGKLMCTSELISELRVSSIAVNRTGDAISLTIELLAGGYIVANRWPTKPARIKDQTTRESELIQAGPTAGQVTASGSLGTTVQHTRQWWPDTRIYVCHLTNDKLQYFDLSPDQVHWSQYPSVLKSTTGWQPIHHYWDQYDPRLLAVETTPVKNTHPVLDVTPVDGAEISEDETHAQRKVSEQPIGRDNEPRKAAESREGAVDQRSRSSSRLARSVEPDRCVKNSKARNVILSMFAGPEQAHPIVQESYSMAWHHSQLLGLEVPYFYFAVRCDLVYRLLNEQTQRNHQLTKSDRHFISNPDSTGLNEVVTKSGQSESFHSSGKLTEPHLSDAVKSDLNGSTNKRVPINNKIHYINRRVMRDFIDLEQADSNTREAILTFSYYLTMGEMDAAFKAMKLIKSTAVWQNMARMCVSTCRLDVARMCLGKMGDATAAMLVREAKTRETEPEAQAGELAIQLGMLDEAERLFTKCGRWDLLIHLHQTMGHWDKALKVATSNNRIASRATHYAYARELEKMGMVPQAIEHYIKSETHRFEVPRMLKNSPNDLETFVNTHPDKSIQRWWAQTLETEGRLDEAREYYLRAKDYLSMVRVLCCMGQNDGAEELCNETGDPSACYHLARQLENSGNIDQAIRLFTRAKAISSAVRLCKEHNRNDHLYSLAQLGRPEDMLEAATHLESVPAYANKAILLFNKAGHIGRAVELAFKTRQFAALQSVAGSLDDRIDPALLKKCAEFFVQNNQFDRAVDVLAAGKQYWEALRTCAEYNVPIADELAERLTPPTKSALAEAERVSILVELGELCLGQGQYHIACKKFTQAGSRIAAMKALLRSGDTEKIIFFANVSKQREIYVMAANYLQTLAEWRTNVDNMRTIVQFYTRGRAPESLASFYESCAQVEIEEYGNYEKATGALAEAYKVLLKAVNSTTLDESSELRIQKRLADIRIKVTMCKEFAETQMLFAEDPVTAMRNCQTLLESAEPGDILRPGDIYAAMIKEFVAKGKYQAAFACMDEMRERLQVSNQSITKYIDRHTLELIYQALDIPIRPVDLAKSNVNTGKKGKIDQADSPMLEDPIVEASISEISDED